MSCLFAFAMDSLVERVSYVLCLKGSTAVSDVCRVDISGRARVRLDGDG